MSKRNLLSGMFLGCLVLSIIIYAVFFPDLHSVQAKDAILEGPSSTYFLGTDHLGRDLFSRLIYGARISIGLAFLSSLVSIFLGFFLGVIAAFFGKFVDGLILRGIETILSLPDLLLVILISLAFGKGFLGLLISLSTIGVAHVTRLVRTEALNARQAKFMEASTLLGSGIKKKILLHILPLVTPLIVVTIMYRVPVVIVEEATISFLGLGIAPPSTSWGLMASETWGFMEQFPSLVFLPCLFISLTVLSFHDLARSIQRKFDRSL